MNLPTKTSSYTRTTLVPRSANLTKGLAGLHYGREVTRARHDSRRLVIAAGLSDDDIDRMIKQAQREVEPLPG